MKDLADIFEHLNLICSEDIQRSDKLNIGIQYINNPDGSIRWIWPSKLRRPLFLKFYSVTSIKSRIIVLMIKLVFLLRLQNWMFKKTQIVFRQTNEIPLIDYMKNNWALFTGTCGPNRKAIVFKETKKGNTFMKIGLNSNSKMLIRNEVSTINHLKTLAPNTSVYPTIMQSGESFVEISDISCGGKRKTSISSVHLNALKELYEESNQAYLIEDLPVWIKLKVDLEKLKSKEDNRIPKGLLKKVSFLIDSINSKAVIETSFCHGDFTPWNMFVKDDKLHVYDWELSKQEMPVGYDMLHFIIQKGILIERKPWIEIQIEINEILSSKTYDVLSTFKIKDAALYLKLYLISNIIFSLNVFNNQKDWHAQVHWSLNTWNDAVSSMLSNYVKHRSLLLMDLFDFLLNKPYAAIKFPNTFPEQLDDLSDADLCVDKTTSRAVCSYLKTHPTVLSCMVVNKSYMAVLELICYDGSRLFVDLIWELRRKSLVLMEVQPLIKNAVLNNFQIKIPQDEDLGRFICLFYNSNNAAVPAKYLKYTNTLKMSSKPIDQKVFQISKGDKLNRCALIQVLNKERVNRGVSKLRNGILYLKDLAKEAWIRPGLIITFSGVDGAGKSTIIENVKSKIEKTLRRRVVVIRHRPSILPILSVWTKGRKRAEHEATIRLPRQGKNSNFLSSLLRFSYYYIDYLIGQFVIYFKFCLRGYVVLYDRYYFDFINDSKRSNIELPSFLTRAGYNFLLKPNLNFFLYADTNLIRSRKKELDSKTIEKLTAKYKSLFKELNEKDPKRGYVLIENINLNKTISTILNRITDQNTCVI
jgi:thymidylate kinase